MTWAIVFILKITKELNESELGVLYKFTSKLTIQKPENDLMDSNSYMVNTIRAINEQFFCVTGLSYLNTMNLASGSETISILSLEHNSSVFRYMTDTNFLATSALKQKFWFICSNIIKLLI